MQLKSILAGVSFVVAAVAQASTSRIAFTVLPTSVTAGKPVTLQWGGGDGSAVTITLQQGTTTNLQTVSVITGDATGTTYTWTPSTSLPNAENYALKIEQGDAEPNYTGMITLTGGSSSSSSASSTSSSASASASSAATTSSASSGGVIGGGSSSSNATTTAVVIANATTTAVGTGAVGTGAVGSSASGGAATGTAMHRNKTMSIATLTSLSTSSSSSSSAAATSTSGGSTTSSGPAPSSSSKSGAVVAAASNFALLCAAVVGVMYLG